jgi:tetratricopeptide (TPR) repeat protein
MRVYKKNILVTGLILGFLIIIICIGVFVRVYPDATYNVLISLRVPSTVLGEIYSKDAIILYKLGSRHMGGDGAYNLKLAEQFLSEAIVLDERLPYVHYQRARIYFVNSQYAKARAEVNKEIEYNPDYARSYYLRGLINGYDGKLEQASEDFTEFITRKPYEWAGYVDHAWVLFQLGDYEGVRNRMETILETSRNAWLLNAYGVALLNLGENEKALEAFNEAKNLASRMTPEQWGVAYIGNDPRIYTAGLEEMRKNINENIERVNNALLEK